MCPILKCTGRLPRFLVEHNGLGLSTGVEAYRPSAEHSSAYNTALHNPVYIIIVYNIIIKIKRIKVRIEYFMAEIIGCEGLIDR